MKDSDSEISLVMPLDVSLSSLAHSRTGTDTNTDETEASMSSLKLLETVVEGPSDLKGRRRKGSKPASRAGGDGDSPDDDPGGSDGTARSRTDTEAVKLSELQKSVVPVPSPRGQMTPRGPKTVVQKGASPCPVAPPACPILVAPAPPL